MNGLLLVNKPTGMTSHDVVNRVRRLAGLRRVGHTGTLDPLADGVLPVLLGEATRLAQFLSGANKTYRAVIRLGQTTDTYDAAGRIVEERPVAATRAEVEAQLAGMRGAQLQVPPMYSAIKMEGKPLHQLARRGVEVAREPRSVEIHALELIAWAPPDLTLTVTCSAGTYVRSLAHDLGQALGCGAHVRQLTRTASGPFTLDECHTLVALGELAAAGQFEAALLPPPAALYALPAVTLDAAQIRAVRYGQAIDLDIPTLAADGPRQALAADGALVAVLFLQEDRCWHPRVVMASV